jgi:hypothetical protein
LSEIKADLYPAERRAEPAGAGLFISGREEIYYRKKRKCLNDEQTLVAIKA